MNWILEGMKTLGENGVFGLMQTVLLAVIAAKYFLFKHADNNSERLTRAQIELAKLSTEATKVSMERQAELAKVTMEGQVEILKLTTEFRRDNLRMAHELRMKALEKGIPLAATEAERVLEEDLKSGIAELNALREKVKSLVNESQATTA